MAKKAATRRKPRPRTKKLPGDWPAASVESRPLAELVPYARNARTHSKAQVAKIAASIREWGWTVPVLVDEENTIIAGHGRVMAAEVLELEAVPVMVARGWTEAQRRAYVIADNRLALDAGWDLETLAGELEDLADLDFDLDLTGFDADEREKLRGDDKATAAALADADAADLPDVQEVVVTKPGDVWILGRHRIACGDSTRADDVARLMLEDVAELVVADPPYGMGKEKDGVANDNLYREKLDTFQMAWWAAALEHVSENGSAYLWGNAPDLWRLWYTGGLSRDRELLVRNEIVWNKGSAFGMRSAGHWFGRSQFQPISAEHYATLQKAADGVAFVEDYEELFERLFPGLRDGGNEHRRQLSEQVRGSRTYFDNTHDKMSDVWEFGRVHGEERFGHATPKPVAMIGRCVASSSPEDGVVFDPFSGTGTVLVACEILGRSARALELEPAYVDVAVRRWQAHAGAAATLEGDGRTFDAIAGGGR